MPPPPLLTQTIVELDAGATRREQPADVVKSAISPVSSITRAAGGHRGAQRRRHRAVDPVRAAVGEEAQPLLRRRARRSRRRGSASTSATQTIGAVGGARSSRRDQRSARSVRRRGQRGRDEVVGLAPARRAIPDRRAPVSSSRAAARRKRPRARPGRSSRPRAWARARRAYGSTTSCGESRQPRAQRLRGGQCRRSAARARACAPPPSRRCAAGRRSGRSRASGRAGRSARRRAGRRARASRWPRRAAPPARRTARRRAADDRAARGRRHARSSIGAARGASARRLVHLHPRAAVGAPRPVRASSSSGTGRERLAQREVQVHDAGPPAERASRRRGRRARGGGSRRRASARGCPPPRTTWRTSRTA